MSLALHALGTATETMHTFKHTLVSHRNCAASQCEMLMHPKMSLGKLASASCTREE